MGLLLFFTGDGVESGYLAPYLTSLYFSPTAVGTVFTVYGLTAALAGWLSGALSDVWGPRRVITIDLSPSRSSSLSFGIKTGNYTFILIGYCNPTDTMAGA